MPQGWCKLGCQTTGSRGEVGIGLSNRDHPDGLMGRGKKKQKKKERQRTKRTGPGQEGHSQWNINNQEGVDVSKTLLRRYHASNSVRKRREVHHRFCGAGERVPNT